MTGANVIVEHSGLDADIQMTADALALETRAGLGLPVDRPIVAAGHQPRLHHGGLVAKDMAVRSMATRCAGISMHLMLDTSLEPVLAERVPLQDGDAWSSTSAFDVDEAGDPLWRRRPARISGAAAGIDLANSVDAVSQAEGLLRWQWARLDLDPALIRASALLTSPGGRSMLAAMRSDPARCARALAGAIAAAGVTDMRTPDTGADPELPLWVTAPEADEGRRMARASDLDCDGAVFEPRAVLTSCLMRRFVSDRWVHGTGGAHYDRATEGWMRDWIGVELPAATFITAHVRLDAAAWHAAMTSLEGARSELRSVRHGVIAGRPSSDKAQMLQAIDSAPRGSRARRTAFEAMHDQLRTGLDARVARAETALDTAIEQARILQRRDWPLVALDPLRARELAEAIDAALEA